MRHPPVEVYLVRHGETEWNAEGRFQGALDSPLTPHGREQAARIGRRLAGILPDDVIELRASPLDRARRTADIVASHLNGRPPMIDARLREISLGEWDGLTVEDIDAGWPDRLTGSTFADWYFRAPGGESLDAAIQRAAGWLASLEYPVIAVSHGLFGRVIRGVYGRLKPATMLSTPIPQDVIWHLRDGEVHPIPA